MNFVQLISPSLDVFYNLCNDYAWIGEATHVVKLDAVDALLQPTASSLNLDLPLFKVQSEYITAYFCIML